MASVCIRTFLAQEYGYGPGSQKGKHNRRGKAAQWTDSRQCHGRGGVPDGLCRLGPLTMSLRLSALSRHWIDHLTHLGYLGGREATALCVLMNKSLTVGEIDAEGLISCHIGVFPLNILPLSLHFGEHGIGFVRCIAQCFTFRRTDSGNITLNNISRHDGSSSVRGKVITTVGL